MTYASVLMLNSVTLAVVLVKWRNPSHHGRTKSVLGTMGHPADVLDLAEQAYQAALAPLKWRTLLDSMAQKLRCSHVLLFFGPVEERRVVASGLDDSDLVRFAAPESVQLGRRHYYDMIPSGRAVSSSSFLSDAEMERSAFYNEVIRPAKGFRGASLAGKGSSSFLMSACRGRKEKPFGREELGLLQSLFPHMHGAVEIANRLNAAEKATQGLCQLLEGLREGVVLLDGGAMPVFANRRAHLILSQRDGLLMGPSGLVASLASHDRQLRKTILKASAPNASAEAVQLCIPRPSERPSLMLRILPICAFGFSEQPSARVAVFLNEPDALPSIDRIALRDVFGLTERESDVAILLVEGASLNTIAEKLCLSLWTVRHYLKLIFEKTGANSQVALTARLRGFTC